MSKMLPFTRPTLDEETIQGVAEVLRSGWLASGPKVAEFEAALSSYLGGRPVRTQTSATASMEISAFSPVALARATQVITPAMSFVATANVIVRTGARPVFVDVGLDSRNINLDQVEAAITPRTRAILPVHFGGLPVDMDRLYDIAKRNKLRVVEDAAHAIGSAWKGRRIGSFGDLVCFSFHPNKNITTIEGGAVSGGSPDEIKALELHRWHGQRKTPDGVDTLFAGGKANLSDVAARVGLGQLPHLEEFNSKRRQLVDALSACGTLEVPLRFGCRQRGDDGHSWHIFAPLLPLERHEVRDLSFIEAMRERVILRSACITRAIHLFDGVSDFGYAREGSSPTPSGSATRRLRCRLFPAMEMSDVDRVVNAVDADIIRGQQGESRDGFDRHSGLQRRGGSAEPVPIVFTRFSTISSAAQYELIFVDDGSTDHVGRDVVANTICASGRIPPACGRAGAQRGPAYGDPGAGLHRARGDVHRHSGRGPSKPA